MFDSSITTLNDLVKLRSAPYLNDYQTNQLFSELLDCINDADWFTVGIMASSSHQAITTLRTIENCFHWSPMTLVTQSVDKGPVFLKANQNTGDMHIRLEYGLGEGVLIGCQYFNDKIDTLTLGPLPFSMFNNRNKDFKN